MNRTIYSFTLVVSTLTLSACGGGSGQDANTDPSATGLPLDQLMTNVARIKSFDTVSYETGRRDRFDNQYRYSSPSTLVWVGGQAVNSRVQNLRRTQYVTGVEFLGPNDTHIFVDPNIPYKVLGTRTLMSNGELRTIVTESLSPLPVLAEQGWSEVTEAVDVIGVDDDSASLLRTEKTTGTVNGDEFCLLTTDSDNREEREVCYQTNTNGDVLRIRENAYFPPSGERFFESESVGPILLMDSN